MGLCGMDESQQSGRAEIEPISAVIRVWLNAEAKYGDPYEWVATVRYVNRRDIEILGYVKPITPSIWKAARRELQRLGIERVLAVTYTDGVRSEMWIQVPSRFQEYYK